MTKLESEALGKIPVSKETVAIIYDMAKDSTREWLISRLRRLCESHERLRMEVIGAMSVVDSDKESREALFGMCERMLAVVKSMPRPSKLGDWNWEQLEGDLESAIGKVKFPQ